MLVAAKEYLNESCFLDRGKKIINWKEAAKLPLITLKNGHALRSSVDVLYANAEVKPNIFFESHSNMLSYRLAAQGLGVAIIPEITLELMEGGMEADVYHLSVTPVQLAGHGIVPGRLLYRRSGTGTFGYCERNHAGS